MCLRGVCRLWGRRVRPFLLLLLPPPSYNILIDWSTVTDMLIAVLSCCSKEELEEGEPAPISPTASRKPSPSPFPPHLPHASSSERHRRAPPGNQEQDPGRWPDVARVLVAEGGEREGERAEEY